MSLGKLATMLLKKERLRQLHLGHVLLAWCAAMTQRHWYDIKIIVRIGLTYNSESYSTKWFHQSITIMLCSMYMGYFRNFDGTTIYQSRCMCRLFVLWDRMTPAVMLFYNLSLRAIGNESMMNYHTRHVSLDLPKFHGWLTKSFFSLSWSMCVCFYSLDFASA